MPRGSSSSWRSRPACTQEVAQHDHGALLRRQRCEAASRRRPTGRGGMVGGRASARASPPTSARSAARDQSIARLTTIRWSQGPNGLRRSKRSSARTAARNASWAMSSAAARVVDDQVGGAVGARPVRRKRASRSETDPAWAPRTQARSSRAPGIPRRLYERAPHEVHTSGSRPRSRTSCSPADVRVASSSRGGSS